jgi:hypothetical protein
MSAILVTTNGRIFKKNIAFSFHILGGRKEHEKSMYSLPVKYLSNIFRKYSPLSAISTNNLSTYSLLHKLGHFFQTTQITQLIPIEGGNWNTDRTTYTAHWRLLLCSNGEIIG